MSGWFTERYFPNVKFVEPERLTPDEARQRKFFDDLSRQRKVLEERSKLERLSPANMSHLQRLKEFEFKFGDRLRSLQGSLKKAPDRPLRAKEALRFAAARSELFQLMEQRRLLNQRVAKERRAGVLFQASAADRRWFFPGPAFFRNPRTIFGTEARTNVDALSRRVFKHPAVAVPCLQRIIRREVMFAAGHGGRGHKGRRRFSPLSLIGC